MVESTGYQAVLRMAGTVHGQRAMRAGTPCPLPPTPAAAGAWRAPARRRPATTYPYDLHFGGRRKTAPRRKAPKNGEILQDPALRAAEREGAGFCNLKNKNAKICKKHATNCKICDILRTSAIFCKKNVQKVHHFGANFCKILQNFAKSGTTRPKRRL